jgi:isopenicillin N synthase-like dioxygenase
MKNYDHLINTHPKILQSAFITNNDLHFEQGNKFEQAIRDGFFLLQIPEYIDLKPGIKLGETFYKEQQSVFNPYSGFKHKENIYFDREHFQTEHVLLDQNSRKKVFPSELNALCNQMNQIGITILEYILRKLEIPEGMWPQITGGAIENKGTHWFACSHYRTYLSLPGCATHKDTGFVTVLYIDQSGLQAYIDDTWVDIEPVPNYFVINFGASLEILTQNLKYPVKAILHRVKEIKSQVGIKDRYSFAAFLNPPTNLDLYQYDENKRLQIYMPVQQFLDEFNKNVWNDKHEKFGIISNNN